MIHVLELVTRNVSCIADVVGRWTTVWFGLKVGANEQM